MTLDDLEALSRQLLQDDKDRPLVSQAQLRFWINEAQKEACLRAKLLYETGTIAMLAGTNSLDLTPATLGKDYFLFDRFYWVEGGYPLMRSQMESLDYSINGWQLKTGNPAAYLSDMLPRRTRIYPTPQEAYTIEYRGYRYPVTLNHGHEVPEVDSQHHENLTHWLRYRAYSLPDVDLYDAGMSQLALSEFENAFGHRPDADTLNALNRKAVPSFVPNFTLDASL